MCGDQSFVAVCLPNMRVLDGGVAGGSLEREQRMRTKNKKEYNINWLEDRRS